MRIGLLAEKIGMSRFYDKEMVNHSVTILKVKECMVIAKKNKDKHGYNAITLSHGITKKTINNSFKGFLKKNNLKAFSKCQEFRVNDSDQFEVGKNINANNFVVGQFVDVSSNSIGKGFAGGMKRHNFAGNRATHGVSISHRSHGSTGQCQDPGKVFKGKKMAGRLGNKKITIQNLKVLNIDLDNNLLVIKGAVPGHKGSLIRIVDAVKKNQSISSSINESTNETKEIKSDQGVSTKLPENDNAKSTEVKEEIINKTTPENRADEKITDVKIEETKDKDAEQPTKNEN
tara:strand:+ start:533 stop:1396 length:864 start_codon:yes stop_codon:yes gene_type:complete